MKTERKMLIVVMLVAIMLVASIGMISSCGDDSIIVQTNAFFAPRVTAFV